MEIKNIIINRTANWYTNINIKTNPYYMAISLLEKLSTNLQRGIRYNRFDLSGRVIKQTNDEAMNIVDKSIVILISRDLIRFENASDVNKNIFITELGKKVLGDYREALKNVD
jgi:hypothetical protein